MGTRRSEKVLRRRRRERDARQRRNRPNYDTAADHIGALTGLTRRSLGPIRQQMEQTAIDLGPATRETVSGADAWEYLEEAHDAVVASIEEAVQEISPAQWLFFLRRASSAFASINDLPSSGPYARSIAEVLSLRSQETVTQVARQGKMVYPVIDNGIFFDLGVLVDGAALLYELQGRARWAGKGAPIAIGGGVLPDERPDPDLEAAVHDWDRRRAAGSDILARVGLHYGALRVERLIEETAAPVILVGPTQNPAVPFLLSGIDLKAIRPLVDSRVDQSLIWRPELLDLLLVSLATGMSPAFQKSIRDPRNPMQRYGYRLMTVKGFYQELEHTHPIIEKQRLFGLLPSSISVRSPEAMIGRLAAIESSVWPPRVRTAVRMVNDEYVMVDFYAVSRRLIELIERPNVIGAQTNLWSEGFELDVQRTIDESAWKPSSRTPPRARTLRLNGAALTDVDAWAERDDVVIAISCKAIPFSDAYDRGEYQAIRNVKTTAEQAVADWDRKIAQLRASPVGDNYDLSWAKEIVGVVVCPFTPFVTDPAALADALPGLSVLMGAGALHEWVSE